MPDPTLADSYFGETIVISTLNSRVNLLKLMQAIAPNLSGQFTSISILSDSVNTAPLLIGSDRISPTNFGYSVAPGGVRPYPATGQTAPVPTARIWLWVTAVTTLHVEAYL